MKRTLLILTSLSLVIGCGKQEDSVEEARQFGEAQTSATVETVSIPPLSRGIKTLKMTRNGLHLAAHPDTPANFLNAGNMPDCSAGGAGVCDGRFYAFREIADFRADDTTPVAVALHVTPLGAHIGEGWKLPTGHANFGAVADCGGGYCFGSQLLSYRRQPFKDIPVGGKYLQAAALVVGPCAKDWYSAGTMSAAGVNVHLCGLAKIKGASNISDSSSQVTRTSASGSSIISAIMPSEFVGTSHAGGAVYRVYRAAQILGNLKAQVSNLSNLVQCAQGSQTNAAILGKAVIRFTNPTTQVADQISDRQKVACVGLKSDGSRIKFVSTAAGNGIDTAVSVDPAFPTLPDHTVLAFEQYTLSTVPIETAINCQANAASGTNAVFGCNNAVSGYGNVVVGNSNTVSGENHKVTGSCHNVAGPNGTHTGNNCQ